MASKKGGLGKGLDILIPSGDGFDFGEPVKEKASSKPMVQEVIKEVVKEVVREVKVYDQQYVKIWEIEPNPNQPRKEFDENALEELEASIRQYGVLQPLMVKKLGDHYEIIAGERRWRAAKMAGLKEVPVIVKNLSEQEISEVSLIENIQRESLNPIEEAFAYQRLLEDYGLRQEDLAKRVGKGRASITNAVRLLKLAQPVQDMLRAGVITTGHAKALLSITDLELQTDTALLVEERQLSVRETEKLVKDIQNPKAPKKVATLNHAELFQQIQEKLTERMGTKVEIKRKNDQAGRIEISYFSNEELERILDVIGMTVE